jgi:hypothetical protein
MISFNISENILHHEFCKSTKIYESVKYLLFFGLLQKKWMTRSQLDAVFIILKLNVRAYINFSEFCCVMEGSGLP